MKQINRTGIVLITLGTVLMGYAVTALKFMIALHDRSDNFLSACIAVDASKIGLITVTALVSIGLIFSLLRRSVKKEKGLGVLFRGISNTAYILGFVSLGAGLATDGLMNVATDIGKKYLPTLNIWFDLADGLAADQALHLQSTLLAGLIIIASACVAVGVIAVRKTNPQRTKKIVQAVPAT